MSAGVNEEIVLWETLAQQTCILVRDPVTKRIVAQVPGTDAQAQAEARQIAASGFLLKTMEELVTWAQENTSHAETDTDTPLYKARLALMITTGRGQ